MSDFGKGVLSVFSAIIAVAIVAVIVSKQSDSAGLVQSLGTSLSNLIKSAVTPVPPPVASVPSSESGSPLSQGFWEGLIHQPFF